MENSYLLLELSKLTFRRVGSAYPVVLLTQLVPMPNLHQGGQERPAAFFDHLQVVAWCRKQEETPMEMPSHGWYQSSLPEVGTRAGGGPHPYNRWERILTEDR